MGQTIQLIPVFLLAILSALPCAAATTKPVRVFILASQSNMEGAGVIKADPKRNGGRGSLEFLVKDAATAKRFTPLVDSAGRWRTRDDVRISYLDRKRPLTVGFGALPAAMVSRSTDHHGAADSGRRTAAQASPSDAVVASPSPLWLAGFF